MKSETKAPPLGVKLISIYFYASAIILTIFIGIHLLIFLPIGLKNPGNVDGLDIFIGYLFWALLPLVMASVPIAILSFFIGRGLWNGGWWARIVAIIPLFLGSIFFVDRLISNFDRTSWFLIPLIINLIVIIYLFFNKKAKEYFKN
jgi:hypothetical protein